MKFFHSKPFASFFFWLNIQTLCITCCRGGKTRGRRCFGFVTLGNSPSWVGACYWLLADKNNLFTAFNSCRPFGPAEFGCILACCQGFAVSVCQETAISVTCLFFFFFCPKKQRENRFNTPYIHVASATFHKGISGSRCEDICLEFEWMK